VNVNNDLFPFFYAAGTAAQLLIHICLSVHGFEVSAGNAARYPVLVRHLHLFYFMKMKN